MKVFRDYNLDFELVLQLGLNSLESRSLSKGVLLQRGGLFQRMFSSREGFPAEGCLFQRVVSSREGSLSERVSCRAGSPAERGLLQKVVSFRAGSSGEIKNELSRVKEKLTVLLIKENKVI